MLLLLLLGGLRSRLPVSDGEWRSRGPVIMSPNVAGEGERLPIRSANPKLVLAAAVDDAPFKPRGEFWAELVVLL